MHTSSFAYAQLVVPNENEAGDGALKNYHRRRRANGIVDVVRMASAIVVAVTQSDVWSGTAAAAVAASL